MKIQVLNIRRVNTDSSLRAFATVCFDNTLVVKGCGIFEGRNGLFATFPSDKGKDGKYYPIVYFSQAAEALKMSFSAAVVAAYAKQGASDQAVEDQATPF